MPFVHPVQVYYEDTDHSGVVYHANYLRYMERAREHLLGVPELVRLWEEERVGFVVYQCSMKFKEGARFGDGLEVRTRVEKASDYRAVFEQNVYRVEDDRLLVLGRGAPVLRGWRPEAGEATRERTGSDEMTQRPPRPLNHTAITRR